MLFSRKRRTSEIGDDKLPFAVAVTRRKINSTMYPLRKFLLLIDHFDSLIRTSVIFIGAAALNGGDLANFFQSQQLDERPSLGHWVQALRELQSHAPAFRYAALPNDLFDRINRVLAKAEQANIVKLRNERRGHSYLGLRDAEYRDEYDAYGPIVNDIETLLKPVLTRLSCYHVINNERLNESEFQVTGKSIMGSYPDFFNFKFVYKPINLQDIPYSNRCYLYIRNDEKWISLHPYLQFTTCPECDHARVLIADGNCYIDPYVGHRVTI